MASRLKFIGKLQPKQPTVFFIPGGVATPPFVFDGLAGEIPWQSAQIDWSRSPGPWDIKEIGNRVLELVEELDLGPTVLAGYSAGGIIALQAAIKDNAGRIGGLLLSNTGPCAIGHGDPDLPARLRENWYSEEIHEPFLNRCFAFPIPQDLKERMIAYAKTIDKEVVYQSSKTIREHDLRPQLGEITCPVVIAHGKLDETRTLHHVEMLVEGIADTEVFLLDGGHTIMVEDRKNWLKALLHLIEKLPCTFT